MKRPTMRDDKLAWSKYADELKSMLLRVIDELRDPHGRHWCDCPEKDKQLLESLLIDVEELMKERCEDSQ